MFEDFEIDYVTLGLTVVVSALFILMIWKVPTWDSYPTKYKIFLSVMLPIVSYPFVLRMMNN